MEKEPIRVKLSTVIIIIAIIIIIGMGVYVYYLLNREDSISKNVTELNNVKEENYENLIENDLNENNDGNKDVDLSNNDKKQIENVINTYYKLLGDYEEEPASMLVELGFNPQTVQDPDYAPEGYIEYPNARYMWTGIKYEDFLDKMLDYMSEDVLNTKFKDCVEYKDYLYTSDNLNSNCKYTIESMKLQESSEEECRYLISVKKSSDSKIYNEEILLEKENKGFIVEKIINN